MTPERWEQVSRLYESASALGDTERDAFLREACADDDGLRGEVESLLASDAAAGSFLAAGALLDTAKLIADDDSRSLVGRDLGHYQVVSVLGSGGMAEVYRGRDSRLDREVAIKVLPGLVAASAQGRARFEREAKTIAALPHPNIRSLYDVGEVDGRLYAVMELLEGDTLRERLARGSLPRVKAIEIGAAIADGLAAAHARGIVHRDLKPENVFITTSGQAKVLDFGLAQTQSSRSEQGLVLGTVGYMSPEQATGGDVDPRSDIFAFGCVLYEMLTGRRAFKRNTTAETLRATVCDEVAELQAIDADLGRIIAHCLEKEPGARFQSAHDLAFHLRALPPSCTVGVVGQTARERRGSGAIWAIGATAAAVVVAIGISMWSREPASLIYSSLLPPADAEFCHDCGIAISPDGGRVAVVARRRSDATQSLWIQSLSQPSGQHLPGTEGARYPFWSPDGRSLAFFSGDALKKIDALSDSPQTLCTPCSGQGTWSREGVIVFGRAGRSLWGVSASGGNPFQVTDLDPAGGDGGHVHPTFLSDGRRLLFRNASNASPWRGGIYAASLDSRVTKLVTVVPGITTPHSKVFTAAGHLLFVQEDALIAVPFDEAALRIKGKPQMIGQTGGPFAVASAGALLYVQRSSSQLVWFNRAGGEVQALPTQGAFGTPELSHDGRRVAVTKMADRASGAGDIWVYDLTQRLGIRLTTDPAHDHRPAWSPDDEWIAFNSDRRGRLDVYRKRSTGVGNEELISFGDFQGQVRSWPADDLLIAQNSEGASDLWQLSLLERRATRLFNTPSNEGMARVSPDGRYIAYVSDETGQPEVYVQTFPSPVQRKRVSRAGGIFPKWRGDGRELFFADTTNRRIMAVDVTMAPIFSAGVPRPLIETTMLQPTGDSFDVTADGQRFLVIKALPEAGTRPITLVQNWTAALKIAGPR